MRENRSWPATGRCTSLFAETTAFFEKFLPLVAGANHCEVVIAPPFVNIPAALSRPRLEVASEIGAQNVLLDEGGRLYRRRLSAPMLKSGRLPVGDYRPIASGRQYFGETD